MRKLWLAILFVLLALPVSAQRYLGDYAEDYADLNCKFPTTNAAGVPTTLSGAPAVSVYKSNSTTTESTTGVTLVVDFDTLTGLNNVNIDLSADAFYAVGEDYDIIITTGTVDGDSVVGYNPCSFSIQNRYERGTDSAALATGVDVITIEDVDATDVLGTAQTGDSFARLGAPAGASVSADIAAVQADTDDVQTRLPAALVGGRMDGSVGAMAADTITSTATATSFENETGTQVNMSLAATGVADIISVTTTLATYTSQTSFTLAAGSADNDAYNQREAVIIDAATSTQKAHVCASDYVGATKTLTVNDPSVFTYQANDLITIFSTPCSATASTNVTTIEGTDATDAIDARLQANNAAAADSVWDELATGHTDAGKAGEQLWTDIDAVLVDTAEIGAAGAGLTEAGGTGDQYTAVPWNAAWDAEVESEMSDALVAVNLDHVAGTAAPGIAPAGTYLDIMSDDGTATFDRTTDSLQALRDRGDAAWTTGAGTGLTPLASGTAQGGTASTIQLAAGETFADTEPAGNVVKTVGGTGAGQSRLILTYTGATDTAGIAPDWTTTPDATTLYEIVEGAHVWAVLSRTLTALDEDDTTIDLNGTTIGTVTTLTGHTPQTGDSFARLGAPAGASVSADLAAIEAQTDDIGAAGAGLTALLNIDNYTGTWDAAQFGANALVAATFATDYFTAVADRNWDEILESEGSYTAQQIMSVLLAFAAGNNSVDATVFRDPAGNATRIDYTITDGKRVTVVVTPSSDP